MLHHDTTHFYIAGRWVKPATDRHLAVISPANNAELAHISLGSEADVNAAVAAAREAFEPFSQWTVAERIAMLERIVAAYEPRMEDIAQSISREMGAPIAIARGSHAPQGLGHFREAIAVLKTFRFE
ncbi:MAG TPA: aldehyde dehydrogenase family protein, partial [Rhizomicrobium sp.]|nr:aldehyde dehydrogenase family protein [Rhizomicrobium sp.]